MERTVTLVDKSDRPLEECPIGEAHRSPGKLHRAFSAYVFTPDRKQLLLQKRHAGKLFGGTWANTCCSHPFANEGAVAAGQRRLREELGIDCQLRQAGALVYQAEDPGGKGAEHEYDVLLVGAIHANTPIHADAAEVAAWKWMALDELRADMRRNPTAYAPWFHLGLDKLMTSDEGRMTKESRMTKTE